MLTLNLRLTLKYIIICSEYISGVLGNGKKDFGFTNFYHSRAQSTYNIGRTIYFNFTFRTKNVLEKGLDSTQSY